MNDELQKSYEDIIGCLDRNELLTALEKMVELADKADDPNAQADLNEIRNTYKYMLSYYGQGVDDPQRTKIFNELIDKAAKLSAKLLRTADSRIHWQQYYWQCARQRKARSLSDYQRALEAYTEDLALTELTSANALQTDTKRGKLRTDHERTVQEMFTDVWTSDLWQPKDLAEARSLMQSTLVPTNDMAVLMSAVTLGLLKTFDAQKFSFLMDTYYNNDDPLVSQRALLGFVMVYFHSKREVQLAPELQSQLKQLKDDYLFNDEVGDVFKELLRTLEIDKIKNMLEKKVYPNLFNNMCDMFNSTGAVNFEDLLMAGGNMKQAPSDDATNQRNVMRNFGKMASDGVDVNFCNFSHLKKYDFFREMSNWFLPYDPSHSMVESAVKGDKNGLMSFAKAIGQNPTYCDSDKYSFIAVIATMPEDFRQAIVQQNDVFKGPSVEDDPDARHFALRRSVLDYYRFFKLFPKRDEFADPFLPSYGNYSAFTMDELIKDWVPMMEVGDYLLKKERIEEALLFYDNALKHNATNIECLEKLGTCFEQLQEYDEAAEYFSKAELLDSTGNDILIRNLAYCYFNKPDYPKAIEYYNQLLQKDPDNITYLGEIAECYENSGQLQKSLEAHYKTLYLDENNMYALSCAAWFNFECTQPEKAEMYYDRLFEHYEDILSYIDYTRAGLVAWARRKYEKAVSLFIKACKLCDNVDKDDEEDYDDNGTATVFDIIQSFAGELNDNGVSDEEFPLMYDTILLRLQEEEG